MSVARDVLPAMTRFSVAALASFQLVVGYYYEVTQCECGRLVNQAELDDGAWCVEPPWQPGQASVCYPLNWDGNCDSNKYKCVGEISLSACESTSFRNGAQPWDEVLCYQDMQRQYLQPTQGCPVELCINCDMSKCDGEADYESCQEKEKWRCCMGKTECLDNQSPEECFDWKRGGECGQVGIPLSCDVDCDDADDPADCTTTQRMQCCVREAVECLLCGDDAVCEALCWEDKREECCAIVGIEDDETCNAVVLGAIEATTTTSISTITSTTSKTTTTTSSISTETSTVSSTISSTATSTVSSTITSGTMTSTVTTTTEACSNTDIVINGNFELGATYPAGWKAGRSGWAPGIWTAGPPDSSGNTGGKALRFTPGRGGGWRGIANQAAWSLAAGVAYTLTLWAHVDARAWGLVVSFDGLADGVRRELSSRDVAGQLRRGEWAEVTYIVSFEESPFLSEVEVIIATALAPRGRIFIDSVAFTHCEEDL